MGANKRWKRKAKRIRGTCLSRERCGFCKYKSTCLKVLKKLEYKSRIQLRELEQVLKGWNIN